MFVCIILHYNLHAECGVRCDHRLSAVTYTQWHIDENNPFLFCILTSDHFLLKSCCCLGYQRSWANPSFSVSQVILSGCLKTSNFVSDTAYVVFCFLSFEGKQ